MQTIVVYTANIGGGGFDKVYSPLHNRLEGVSYEYMSDNSECLDKAIRFGWKPHLVIMTGKRTPRKVSRDLHIHSCNFTMADFSIQHGSNIQLVENPIDLIKKYLGKTYDIAVFRHPHRKSVFQEVHACADLGKDSYTNMWPQVNRYKQEGFDIHRFRLSACMLVLWRHCEKVRQFQELWWEEVKNGSVREQLSFDYVRWRFRDTIKVNFLPGDPFTSPIIKYHQHGA